MHRSSLTARPAAGQGLLEFLLILAALIAGAALFTGPLRETLVNLFGGGAQAITDASALLREQTEPGSGVEGEEADGDKPIVVAGGPGVVGPAPGPFGPGGGLPGGGSTGGGGGGGGSGGGGGGAGGGGAGGTPPSGGSGGGSITPTAPSGSSSLTPTATEQEKIDAARALLLTSAITFSLFDFPQGRFVSHAVASVMNEVARNGVPILVKNLVGALAQVAFLVNAADGTFAVSEGATLSVDRTWLGLSTTTMEKLATVLAHEAWHVHQLFSGIHDDFVNYPRVVDIEYEAFVAEAAVWNAHKGSQTDTDLDAGAACVASGEARCKETLHTDFGYKIGPRQLGLRTGVS